ncbi:UNVERIFIED_CONTAM: hypothetical protein HDU68_008363 [Siphonaria sp. JEL0065]|nr:hypothetical protein HDU68_008363 [Siphonaria sp. JEL0065]
MGASESKAQVEHIREPEMQRAQSVRPALRARGSSQSVVHIVKRSKSVDVGNLRRGSMIHTISAPDPYLTSTTYGSSSSSSNIGGGVGGAGSTGSLYRSNTTTSTSRASVLSASAANLNLEPVNTFKVSLGVVSWAFAKPAAPSANSGRRPLPGAQQWRHTFSSAFDASDAASDTFAPLDDEKAPPLGLVTLDPASGVCRLKPAPLTAAFDVRRLVEDGFANWKKAAVVLARAGLHRMPLHRDEEDANLNISSNSQCENAWIALLDALDAALADLASLDYNKELSTAYEPDAPADEDDDDDTASVFSTSYDTLSKGLILTPQELKLLEYSVSKKVQTLGNIVQTLSTTAACVSVRISYEPRAGNEVDMAKGDLISLWYNFDDEYGFGLNRSNGQIGFVNLGHVDQRKLAVATQAPPLPILAIPPQFLRNTANNSSMLASKSISTNPAVPLPRPPTSNPPPALVRQYQQQQQQQQHQQFNQYEFNQQPQSSRNSITQLPTKISTIPQARNNSSTSSSSPVSLPKPLSRPLFPTTSTTATSSSTGSPQSLTSPHLRISDRLAARQLEAERYQNMESELDSLLSSADGRNSIPPPPRGSSSNPAAFAIPPFVALQPPQSVVSSGYSAPAGEGRKARRESLRQANPGVSSGGIALNLHRQSTTSSDPRLSKASGGSNGSGSTVTVQRVGEFGFGGVNGF